MFTPGRCRKTTSPFWDARTVCVAVVFPIAAAATAGGEAWTGSTGPAALMEGGTSAEAASAVAAGEGSGTLRVASTEATDEDCAAGAGSAVCAGVLSLADCNKNHASAPIPKAATATVPAISFPRGPRFGVLPDKLFCSGASKAGSSLVTGRSASWPRGTLRRISREMGLQVAASGGAQHSVLLSAELSSGGNASVNSRTAMTTSNSRSAIFPFPAGKEDARSSPQPTGGF
jgi:hypothetical protein